MTSNVDDCGAVVVDYLSTLARDFAVHPQGAGRCVLVTPFQRPDGESIEIEVSTLPNGRLRLSDMGLSIAYLYVNGLTVSRTTMDNARRLSRRHGVGLNRSELTVEATPADTTGDSIHGLIQASITVSDLIQVRRAELKKPGTPS